MRKVVFFDSIYGNTEKIARSVAAGFSGEAVRVNEAKKIDLKRIEFLVLGSPTYGGRPTDEIQKFMKQLPPLHGVMAAVFDTRITGKDLNLPLRALVRIIGYAAPKMAKTLEGKRARIVVPPEGFIVKGKEGPLAIGETDRAKSWINNF